MAEILTTHQSQTELLFELIGNREATDAIASLEINQLQAELHKLQQTYPNEYVAYLDHWQDRILTRSVITHSPSLLEVNDLLQSQIEQSESLRIHRDQIRVEWIESEMEPITDPMER